jgi:hypothetical protein
MLNLQHQYNNCTTTPHMKVSSTQWDPSSCEGLLCSCCNSVVQESNPIFYYVFTKRKQKKNNKILPARSACCGAVVRNECRDHFS